MRVSSYEADLVAACFSFFHVSSFCYRCELLPGVHGLQGLLPDEQQRGTITATSDMFYNSVRGI